MIALYFENINNISNNASFVSNRALCDLYDLSYLKKNKNIESVLEIKNNETIINLDFDNKKSNFVNITSGEWTVKFERLISLENNSNTKIQNIEIQSNLKHPFLSKNLDKIKEYYVNKNYNEFIIESELLLQKNKLIFEDYIMLCYYCANVYWFKLKNFDKAKNLLLKCVSIKPNFHEAWCAWADVLLDIGLNKKAIDSYEKCIEHYKTRNLDEEKVPINKSRGYKYPLEKINTIKTQSKNQITLEKLT